MNKTTKTSKSSKAKPSLKEAPRKRPNDSSTHPKDPAPEPNDQTSAERTTPSPERTNENEGDVLASQVTTIPLSISSDVGSTRSDEPVPRSDRPPNWSLLGRKAVELMEWLYLEGGLSVAEIAAHFRGLSKSTVYERIRHLADDGEMRARHDAASARFHAPRDPNVTQPRPNGEQSYPNAPQVSRLDTPSSQPTNEDGSDGSYSPQIPRINSEVVSVRPRVIENNNGYESTNSAGDNDGTTGQTQSSPLDIDLLRILSRDSRWVDVYLAIRAGARQAGVADPVGYFNQHMWQDSRDMELVRTLVPYDPERPESLMENLEILARKANFLDEATKRSGLTAEPQPQSQKDAKA